MRENTDQNNSQYGHFSRSEIRFAFSTEAPKIHFHKIEFGIKLTGKPTIDRQNVRQEPKNI